MEKINFN